MPYLVDGGGGGLPTYAVDDVADGTEHNFNTLDVTTMYRFVMLEDPASLTAAADAWRTLAGALEGQAALLRGKRDTLAAEWTSDAAEVFEGRVTDSATSLDTWAALARDAGGELDDLASVVTTKMNRMQELYDAYGTAVADAEREDNSGIDLKDVGELLTGTNRVTEKAREYAEKIRREVIEPMATAYSTASTTLRPTGPRFQGPVDAPTVSTEQQVALLGLEAPPAPGGGPAAPGGGPAPAPAPAPAVPPTATPPTATPPTATPPTATPPPAPAPTAPPAPLAPSVAPGVPVSPAVPLAPVGAAPAPPPGAPTGGAPGTAPAPAAPPLLPVTAAGAPGATLGRPATPAAPPAGAAARAAAAAPSAAPPAPSSSPQLAGRGAAPAAPPSGGAGQGGAPQLPGRGGPSSGAGARPSSPPTLGGRQSGESGPGGRAPGEPGAPGGRPGAPGRPASPFAPPRTPGTEGLGGRPAGPGAPGRPGTGTPGAPGGRAPGVPEGLQGSRSPGTPPPAAGGRAPGGAPPTRGLSGRRTTGAPGRPETTESTRSALRRGLEGRGLPEEGAARPAGRSSGPGQGAVRPPARSRRREEDQETRAPETVGDAELFDVDDAGSGVVRRPEERRIGPSGPALGQQG